MDDPNIPENADTIEIPQNLDATQALQLLRKIHNTTTELASRMDKLESRLTILGLGGPDFDSDIDEPDDENVEEQLKVLDKIYNGLDVLARMDPNDVDAVLSAMAQKFDSNINALEDEIGILENGRNLAERMRLIFFEKEDGKQRPN